MAAGSAHGEEGTGAYLHGHGRRVSGGFWSILCVCGVRCGLDGHQGIWSRRPAPEQDLFSRDRQASAFWPDGSGGVRTLSASEPPSSDGHAGGKTATAGGRSTAFQRDGRPTGAGGLWPARRQDPDYRPATRSSHGPSNGKEDVCGPVHARVPRRTSVDMALVQSVALC